MLAFRLPLEECAMPTLTIRNLPDDLIERLKAAAERSGRSMEEEVRELLRGKYAARAAIARRIRERWSELPVTSSGEARKWRDTGRP